MIPETITCAREIRDAGIDAIAALNFGLVAALEGLSPDQTVEMSLTFRKIMGEVVIQMINPAVHAFPELETDEMTWAAIAKQRATSRSLFIFD